MVAASKAHVLVGIHGSGKTTAGLCLERKGFAFFPEVAGDVERSSGVCEPPWAFGPHFDEVVLSRELARDKILLRMQQRPFFVETWHVGNLAYAGVRNIEVAAKYQKQIYDHVLEFAPLVYLLEIVPDIALRRTSIFSKPSDWKAAIAFYAQVRAQLTRVFESLCILPIVVDAAQQKEAVMHLILETEKTHCKMPLV